MKSLAQDWHLCRNHVEYWKTFERGVRLDIGIVKMTIGPYHTVGFEWFAPFPVQKRPKRIRWPIGYNRNMEAVFK